jgi:hypothetical protein
MNNRNLKKEVNRMNEESQPVSFRANLIFVYLFMFLFFGLIVSFFPEENILKWLIFNSIIALLASVVNLVIWIFQKHDSKRYFSLTNFVMLWGLTYYIMSPAFKMLYPTTYFWILLSITLGFVIVILMNRHTISVAILNPREEKMTKLIFLFLLTIVSIGFFLSIYVYFTSSGEGEIVSVAILFYFLGFIFMVLSLALLTPPELAKKIKETNFHKM